MQTFPPATPDVADFYGAGGLSTALYDATEGHMRPWAAEIAFYRRLADPPPRAILEVGCGTGRIAWPLAADGHRVLGLDLSGPMLERARQQAAEHPPEAAGRIAFAQADMRHLQLGRRFDLVILPYRVFNHLLTEEDQALCLAALRAHVGETGLVVLDTHHPGYGALLAHDPANPWRLGIRIPAQGVTVEAAYSWTDIDLAAQTFTVLVRYVVAAADGRVLRDSTERLRQRWINPPEMRHLVRLHGFAVHGEHERFGGADADGAGHAGDRMWVLSPA